MLKKYGKIIAFGVIQMMLLTAVFSFGVAISLKKVSDSRDSVFQVTGVSTIPGVEVETDVEPMSL